MPFKQKQPSAAPPAALYVHVPLCRAKCRYCDFYSIPCSPEASERFVAAALAELNVHRGELATPLASVFFGGGTPTVLGGERLGRLLEAIVPLTDAETEWSVEANPATLDGPLCEQMAAAGVNRVNLGVQSLDDDELRLLGRVHTADEARAAVAMLRDAGVENLGLDLIYGIPGQTLAGWSASLDAALSLRPEHLSCYALSFEAGTPMGDDLTAGRVQEMDESLQHECYRAAISAAGAAGLEHYEISNFARAGRQCKHNLTYWRNLPYLGIGPGAASYVGGVRQTNCPDLAAYAQAVLAGSEPPCQCERLTGRTAMAETLMLALRLIGGVDRREFADRFAADPVEAFPQSFERYERLEAVLITPSHVRITPESLFVADTILADLLAEA